ncbi:hypothetical protein D3C73_1140650 [compost metagenome]
MQGSFAVLNIFDRFSIRSVSKPLISPTIVAIRNFGANRAYSIPSLICPPKPGKAGKILSPTIFCQVENPIEEFVIITIFLL